MVTALERARLRWRHNTRCGMMAASRGRGGFTLIEISIVILVIGLIVGGIVVGRDLIAAAQMRSIVSQLERYDAAVVAFRSKYGCLPGDCATATDFGLGDNACGTGVPACDQQFAYPNAGCNGDGNGSLDGAPYGQFFCPEHLGLWYHLRQAALIADTLDGKSLNGSGSGVHRAPVYGASAPMTRLRQVGILAGTMGQGQTRYVLGLLYNGAFLGAALYPIEAFQIDRKLDDGHPIGGRVMLSASSLASCYTGAPLFETYNVLLQSPACTLQMPIEGIK